MTRFWEDIGIVAVILVIVGVLVGGVALYVGVKLSTEHWDTFTVTKLPDRSLQYGGNGQSNSYANLVYTSKGVFSNTDTVIPWKTKSSDIYAQLQQGKTYTCQVAGWRNGFLSMYPDIIKCKGFYS